MRQTVSEIGEIGSPARVPFAILLCCVAACILVFACAVRNISVQAGHSTLAAYVIGFMAVSAAGVGVFAYPYPLHNVFGISELIGYQAPLVFGAYMATRQARENARCILLGHVCVRMGCNRTEPDCVRQAQRGLGSPEASVRPRPKSALRRLVRLVRRGRSLSLPMGMEQPAGAFASK